MIQFLKRKTISPCIDIEECQCHMVKYINAYNMLFIITKLKILHIHVLVYVCVSTEKDS